MSDFRDYDDVIWANASLSLGLTLFDDDDHEVPARRGKRQNVMRGAVRGQDVEVRAPSRFGADLCLVDVGLTRDLLLGMTWTYGSAGSHNTAEPLMPPRAHGLEADRVRRFTTELRATSGIAKIMKRFAHVRIDDTSVHFMRVGVPDGSAHYVDTANAAIQVAEQLVIARGELGVAPWEEELLGAFSVAAGQLGLDVDPVRFEARGTTLGVELGARLSAEAHGYMVDLWGVAEHARQAESVTIETRASRTGHIFRDLFRRRATGDELFDRVFAVEGRSDAVRARCTDVVRAELLGLAELGSVMFDPEGLRLTASVSAALQSTSNLTDWLTRVASAVRVLEGVIVTSPYRGRG